MPSNTLKMSPPPRHVVLGEVEDFVSSTSMKCAGEMNATLLEQSVLLRQARSRFAEEVDSDSEREEDQDAEFWPSDEIDAEFLPASTEKKSKTTDKKSAKTEQSPSSLSTWAHDAGSDPANYPEVGEEGINLRMCVYLGIVHVLAFAAGFRILDASIRTVAFAFALYFFSCLGITAGAHRLWAHKSYKARSPLRFFLMLCCSLANQMSIYDWAKDHRVHHKHSEKDADPHNASRGFFYSHVGWLLVGYNRKTAEAWKDLETTGAMKDLDNDWVVQFQHLCHPWLDLLVCFGFPTVVPYLAWGENPLTAFLVAGVLRYALVLHATWCVNSFAHIFGDHPYSEISPAENALVAVASIGEGWHNWHHTYPWDYAASEMGISSQFNPTKLFIDTMWAMGQAYDCRRATKVWAKAKARMDKKNN